MSVEILGTEIHPTSKAVKVRFNLTYSEGDVEEVELTFWKDVTEEEIDYYVSNKARDLVKSKYTPKQDYKKLKGKKIEL